MYYFIIEPEKTNYFFNFIISVISVFVGAYSAYWFNLKQQSKNYKNKKYERENEQKDFETLKFNYVISVSHSNIEKLKVFLKVLNKKKQELDEFIDNPIPEDTSKIFSDISFSVNPLNIKELQFTAKVSKVIETFAYMVLSLEDLNYTLYYYNQNIKTYLSISNITNVKLAESCKKNVELLIGKSYLLVDSISKLIQTIYQYNENNKKLNLLEYDLSEDDKILYKLAEQQKLTSELLNIGQVNNNE